MCRSSNRSLRAFDRILPELAKEGELTNFNVAKLISAGKDHA